MSARYALIAAEKADPGCPYAVVLMCSALAVSTSAFYAWAGGQPSARARRRVHAVLGRSDDPEVATASERIVRDLMRQKGLASCQPRAYRTTTVRDRSAAPVIADHLGRNFTAPAPGRKLVGDITYVRTWQGWLYLATVIDCHTKAVIGWSMADHMRTDLVCDAITMAAGNVAVADGAVFHSDRGAQYTSAKFADHLASHKLTGSMGRTGVCWDNAMAESFFGALKNELVHRTIFPTKERARTAIAEYIEVFYNRQRLHSALGYKTPAEVADQYRQNAPLAA